MPVGTDRMLPPHAVRRWLPALALLHALLVLAIWMAYFWLEAVLLPAATWAMLAWLWLAWPLVLALARASPGRSLAACGLGVLLLVPAAPTVWFFTAVSINGFAPWGNPCRPTGPSPNNLPAIMRILLLSLAASLPLITPAFAASGNRSMPLVIDGGKCQVDLGSTAATCRGKITITQGSFVLHTTNATYSTDAEGYAHLRALGGPGGKADFHGTLDPKPGEQQAGHIEGKARQIDYDQHTGKAILQEQAYFRKDQTESWGQYMEYDIYQGTYGIGNPATGDSADQGNRIIIAPHEPGADAARHKGQ